MAGKDESFLQRLLLTFKVEAGEHIAAIGNGLVELETSLDNGQRAAVIETVFREAHSMKGAARSVNLLGFETLCQSLENVFAALKRQELEVTHPLLDLLHRVMNRLGALVETVERGESTEDRNRLRALAEDMANALAHGFPRPQNEKEKDQAASAAAIPPVSADFPMLPRSTQATDTLRIQKDKLDVVLLQGEEFLAIKQMAARQAVELQKLGETLLTMQKDWRRILPELRLLQNPVDDGNGRGLASRGSARRIENFLDAQEDRFTGLTHAFAEMNKAARHNQRTVEAMVDGLLDKLKSVAMLPFSSLLSAFPKIVRDLSRDQGKSVALDIRGGEVEIDKRILDEMREPFIHLLRNCIDHGIESPSARQAHGKTERGTIAIDISQLKGSTVEIVVSDDGRGIDMAKVLELATREGLPTKEAGETDGQRLLQFIFRSGISTSPIITDLSGRGLGLAIVRERVEKLGGMISCETTAGQGTAFRMLLPLSLSALRGVLVRVGEQIYLLPTVGLERTARLAVNEVTTVENRPVITLSGKTIPFVTLRAVLELPDTGRTQSGQVTHAAILAGGGQSIAFGVDEVLHEQEVLVKRLGPQLVRVRNVAGATVLADGRVVVILNVPDLMKSAITAASASRSLHVVEEPEAKKSLLVVEDSITSRSLLKNILEISGYDVRTAVDGADAIAALKTGDFDLVVSDVDMPRMNGFELTARIRADKNMSELPVVLVTALDSREDRERGIDVGANAYIVKSSFDKSNLLEAIRRLI